MQCNRHNSIGFDSIRIAVENTCKIALFVRCFRFAKKKKYWQIFNRRWKSISILSHLMSIVVRYTQSTVCLNGETNRRCKVKVVIFVLDFTSEYVEIMYASIYLAGIVSLRFNSIDGIMALSSFLSIQFTLSYSQYVYALVIFLSILNALHSFPSICSESELLIVNNALCFAHF